MATTYIPRQADRQLLAALANGQFCYVLNAHQTGKSSLRVRTMRSLQRQGIGCVSIDLTLLGTRQVTADQWYGAISAELIKGLKLPIAIGQWWRDRAHLLPIQRLTTLIDTVLLAQRQQPIVIFLDEIENLLGLNFATDDLLTAISTYYQRRDSCPDCRRLNFVMLGAATPTRLFAGCPELLTMATPIALSNFSLDQAQTLTNSLREWFQNPEDLLRRIMDWTHGQPFLTQKTCQLSVAAAQSQSSEPFTASDRWLDGLIQRRIIDHWEQQDNPEHLRTIRDRLLQPPDSGVNLLELYRQSLLAEAPHSSHLHTADAEARQALLLTGLVHESQGILEVQNRIYREVFNLKWCH